MKQPFFQQTAINISTYETTFLLGGCQTIKQPFFQHNAINILSYEAIFLPTERYFKL